MKQKLILLLTTLLIIFVFTEIIFTIIVDEDLDGNMSLNYIHLKPFELPILETQKKIDRLNNSKVPDSLAENYEGKNFKRTYFNVRLIPDSTLGWVPNPYFKSNDALYIYNRNGIRSNDLLTEYSDKKKLRIAIFGDSYAHGDEVKFENTIGYYLESKLTELNIASEVLNFAVSGYGMDQAYLRWKKVKEEYNPDIVILGVQFENVKRHINIMRPFYYHTTEIPYSKPRYIIQTNKLQLINNPIRKVENTVDIIKQFSNWKFVNFEGFYIQQDYHPSFLYYSKTISFIASAISQIFSEIDYYKPTSESYKVTYKIFDNFRKNLEAENITFIPVHLPVKNDFDFLTSYFLKLNYNQKFIYDDIFAALKLKHKFAEPFGQLESWSQNNSIDELFVKRHYSAQSNKIIADNIFQFLKKETPTLFSKTKENN